MSVRKPYNGNLGYVASLKCKAPCGGHIVIYRAEEAGIDADWPWIIMHEPSSQHIAVATRAIAYQGMKAAARGEFTEILPEVEPKRHKTVEITRVQLRSGWWNIAGECEKGTKLRNKKGHTMCISAEALAGMVVKKSRIKI